MKKCYAALMLIILAGFAHNAVAQNTYAALIKKAYNFLYEQHDQYAAQTYFEKAAALNPKKGEPYFGIFLCLSATEDQMKALNNAIALEPNVGKYYERRAYLYTSMGKYAERLEDFKNWALFDPQNGEAHANLAWALYRENADDPEVKTHIKLAIQKLKADRYDLKSLKENLPSLYEEAERELAKEAPSVTTAENVTTPAGTKSIQPVPKKKKQAQVIAMPQPAAEINTASSKLADSCATVFAAAIERWSGQMASRSDIITQFTACGSADCRRNQFGNLNEELAAMSNNINEHLYKVLYKNDASFGECEAFAEKLRSAKWKFSESGDKYESASTFAINLKKDYSNYSTSQREQFIQLMFDAYDKGDVAAQDGMKELMDAYEIYLVKKCSTLKAGEVFAGGNVVCQALAKAQSYLKFKLEGAESEQQKNITAAEKKKKETPKSKTEKTTGTDVATATKCKCCKGKAYVSKQVATFHKMSEKRVERVKRYVNGKAEIEVSYEPIGYTTYKTVKEKCNCCDGSGVQ